MDTYRRLFELKQNLYFELKNKVEIIVSNFFNDFIIDKIVKSFEKNINNYDEIMSWNSWILCDQLGNLPENIKIKIFTDCILNHLQNKLPGFNFVVTIPELKNTDLFIKLEATL